MRQQDEKVYNALCDPRTAPWYFEWSNEWGKAPFKEAVHSLLQNGASTRELLGVLEKLANDWKRLKRNYERRPRRSG